MKKQEPITFWAVVEVMGHRKYAGMLSEEELGGDTFIRIDVPASDDSESFSKLFGKGAIYCITPTTEEATRALIKQIQPQPLHIYAPHIVSKSRMLELQKSLNRAEFEEECEDHYEEKW